VKRITIILMVISTASCEEKNAEAAANEVPQLEIKELKLFAGYKGFKDYNFFEWTDEGKISGFNGDLAIKLAGKLNLDLVPVAITKQYQKPRIEMLEEGSVDICLQRFTITEERDKRIDFSTPYFRDGLGVIYRKTAKINSTEDFKDLKVLAFEHTTSYAFIKRYDIECNVIKRVPDEYNRDPSKAVNDNIIDVYLSDYSELREATKRYPGLKVAPGVLQQEPWGVGVKEGRDDLIKAVNWALEQLIKDNEIEDLKKKYDLVEETDQF